MMRRDVFVLAAVVLLCSISCKKEAQTVGYPINPVPFTDVKVTDDFWGSRLKAASRRMQGYFQT